VPKHLASAITLSDILLAIEKELEPFKHPFRSLCFGFPPWHGSEKLTEGPTCTVILKAVTQL